MDRLSVQSTSVVSVGYDPEAHFLEVEYHGGRVYRYDSVPHAAYRLLLKAPSVGQYINAVIKPRFRATRL
ncbi:MAG TPA: KTSC domain-containing protein [Polyangiaceae bacterium]|nr:KTSC domain-containing protein [Polyangiaceae bacterium]